MWIRLFNPKTRHLSMFYYSHLVSNLTWNLSFSYTSNSKYVTQKIWPLKMSAKQGFLDFTKWFCYLLDSFLGFLETHGCIFDVPHIFQHFHTIWNLKGPVHSKKENFLAPAQTNRMQPILVPCEAPFRSNLRKKHWSSGGHWTNINFHFAIRRPFKARNGHVYQSLRSVVTF